MPDASRGRRSKGHFLMGWFFIAYFVLVLVLMLVDTFMFYRKAMAAFIANHGGGLGGFDSWLRSRQRTVAQLVPGGALVIYLRNRRK